VTACTAPEPKVNAIFPPDGGLREYTYSARRFPGGFIKREGRPTEKEILTSAETADTAAVPRRYSHETQVIGMVLSADPVREILRLWPLSGGGRVMAISDIRFGTRAGAVRVGMVNGSLVAIPPTKRPRLPRSTSWWRATDEGIVMVESARSR